MKAYVATVISSEMLLSVGNDMKIRQQNTYGSIYIYIYITIWFRWTFGED
jgi:hypothetical protein